MRDYRTSALIGLIIGFIGFVGLTGVAFYSGIKETARVMAPVLVQPAQAADQVPERHRKANRLDQRHVRQLPLGRVFRWDVSTII